MTDSEQNSETADAFVDPPDFTVDANGFGPNYVIFQNHSQKSSSGVWKHFGWLKYNETVDNKHVYCIQCFNNKRIKKYQRSTSTGNLSRHLKKHHNISLNQTFRVKKDANSISVHREYDNIYEDDAGGSSIGMGMTNKINFFDDSLSDTNNINLESDGNAEEFLIHDINEILIAEVEKRPLLYSSTAYQQEKGLRNQMRRQLWYEIYNSLNHLIPYARLPKIWKNIRDRYHKVKRCMETNKGDDLQMKPKYRYYDLLSFLDKEYELKKEVLPKMENTSLTDSRNEILESYVHEFLVSDDHEHYTSSEPLEIHSDMDMEYDSFEQKPKKIKLSHKTMLDHHQYNKDPTLAEHHEQQQMPGQANSPTKSPQKSYQTSQPHSQKLNSYANISLKESIASDDLLDDTFGNVSLPNIHPNHPLFPNSEDVETGNQEEVEEEVEDVETASQIVTINTDLHELNPSQNEDTEQQPQQPKEIADKSGATNTSEFDIFGNFIAEVMKNMKRSQARVLQIKILNFISEFEESG